MLSDIDYKHKHTEKRGLHDKIDISTFLGKRGKIFVKMS